MKDEGLKIKDKIIEKIKLNKEKIIRVLIAIAISLLIEIFICNFPAFRTMFTNKNLQKEFKVDGSSVIISNINERITSINLYYEPNVQVIVIGFFFLVNGILELIEPIVKTLIAHS